MRALWKVPGSVLVLLVVSVILFVSLPLCLLLTLVWLPLVMGGAIEIDCEPPMFWPMNLVARLFDWWLEV